MAHPLFGPEVRQMLLENDTSGLATFCETLHPATIAEALEEEFTVEEIWRVLQSVDIRKQAAIFEYFSMDWQVKMVEETAEGRQRMARLIEQMSHDDRADLLRRLQPRVVDALLRLVDEANRRDIATLVRYPQDTAGSIMTTDYAWLPTNITVADALDRLRLQAPDRETIYYVYVLDDQRKLLGVVSLRKLILTSRHAVLSDIMDREPVFVRASDDREQVAREIARYDLIAIPVVDEEHRLVGIITHDDVIDVVVEEATEDVYRMGGVGPLAEHYLEADFVTVWRKRAMWLACLFVAELFTFTALSHFEEAIAQVVVLSLFVPLVISTGGNSGSQAATLITRALALGHVTGRDWWRVFRHELFMGVALGVTLGLIGFGRAWWTPEKVRKNPTVRQEAFQVTVPRNEPLVVKGGDVELPPKVTQVIRENRKAEVSLPENTELVESYNEIDNTITYDFPSGCTIRREPVNKVSLAIIIGQAVAAICLWGTLVGSMLPLVFRRLGIDPGIASSPFVATFVDVTGIFIYFSIAKTYLQLAL